MIGKRAIMLLICIFVSSEAAAEPKRIFCQIHHYGYTDSELEYDITYDLATGMAEVMNMEPGVMKVYAGKIVEFPSVLRIIFDNSFMANSVKVGGIKSFDVDRKTLHLTYPDAPGGAVTGECVVKKLDAKKNKI